MKFTSLAWSVVAVFFAFNVAHAAPPTLGSDCGVGATVVGDKTGDKYAAGKVTIGADPEQNFCTLTFPGGWSKVPSCSASLESGINAYGYPVVPQPYATVTSATQLRIVYAASAVDDMQPGYVISYLCVGQ